MAIKQPDAEEDDDEDEDMDMDMDDSDQEDADAPPPLPPGPPPPPQHGEVSYRRLGAYHTAVHASYILLRTNWLSYDMTQTIV